MNAPPTPSVSSEDRPGEAWARAVLQHQVDILGELAEIGLDIARAAGRKAAQCGETPSPDGADNTAMAYARVARAVRLTLMLQAKLVTDIRRLDAAEDGRIAEIQDAEARSEPEYRHKVRVERIVERVALAAHGDDEDKVDALMREAGERLDDDDIYRDILTRPVGELVASLCRDLNLDPDWAKLAQEAWAQDEESDPRSPFWPDTLTSVQGLKQAWIARAGPHPVAYPLRE